MPKPFFKVWRNLDIFNNYNNFQGGKNLLYNFRENYKILEINRIYQTIYENKYNEYKRLYNNFKLPELIRLI